MRHAARQLRAWLIFDVRQNMKTIAYLSGVALFDAGIVALILGASDFQASVLLCGGALVGAASGSWIIESKGRRAAGLGLMLVFGAYLLVTTFSATESHAAFSLLRRPWFGIPFASIVSVVAILQTRKAHAEPV
jgi:hypothetical protein